MDDPEFIEYKKYFNETKQRIRNQFQALEDAGFIRMSQSPIPRIGRREPEPEPEPEPNTQDLIEHMGQLGINLKDLEDLDDSNLHKHLQSRFVSLPLSQEPKPESESESESEPKPESEPEQFEFDYEKTSYIDEQGPDLLWFGDPCYVVPDDLWGHFCVLDSKHQYKVIDKGLPCPFYVWMTAWGDGEYDLKINGKVVASLGVDAGMLSMIPMRIIKKWRKESGENLGDVLEGSFSGGYASQGFFKGELVVEKGNMSFNGFEKVTILTDL